MVKKSFITQILVLLFLVLQVRCAPSAMEANENNSTTGFTTPSGAPYTAGGDQRIINDRKNSVNADPNVLASTKKLAAAITSVRFVRYNKENKIDRFGTNEIRVELIINGSQKIGFQGALSSVGAYRSRSAVIIGNQGNLQIEAEFEDQADERFSSGRFRVSQMDERKRAKATVDIFMRSYAAAVSTTLSAEQKLDPVNQRFVQLVTDKAFAWVSNIVIQSGRSFYEVNIFATNSQNKDELDKAASGRRLFSFAGEAVRTGDFTDAPATRLTSGLMKPLEVELVGDAEDTDQRTFAITLEGYKNQNIELLMKIEKPEKDVPRQPVPTHKTSKGLTASSYLKVDLTIPSVKKMIEDFENNYGSPGVSTWIQNFTRKQQDRDYLIKSLQTAQPFRPLVQTIFQSFGVAPPAALVTFIESSFFGSGKFKLETNPESTASGPFQLLYGTAKDMGMKVFENAKGVLPKAGDHRLFFVPSACGAADHLQKSVASIAKKDSTMAIAAYYLGNGGVASQIHQALTGVKPAKKDLLQLIKKYNLVYKDVARQRILPSHVITYVNRALALYFVTGNPIDNNFNWGPETGAKLPPNVVMPAFSEIQNSTCRQAVSNLMTSGNLR